jgi:hypothetical protein
MDRDVVTINRIKQAAKRPNGPPKGRPVHIDKAEAQINDKW